MNECCVRCGNTEFLLDHVVEGGRATQEIVCYLCAEEEFMEAA